MKPAIATAITAVMVVAALVYTRADRPAPTHKQTAETTKKASTVSTVRNVRAPADHYEIPRLDERPVDAQHEPAQDKLWGELRGFASDVKLTDEQWDHFVQDLTELAEMDRAAWDKGLDEHDWTGTSELTESLDRELLTRCAAYMTKEQVAELRFRFLSLVTRVRLVIPQS